MNSKISIAAAIAAALPARRIITRGVIDMATSAVLESEGYLYSGPMALADESSDAQLSRSPSRSPISARWRRHRARRWRRKLPS